MNDNKQEYKNISDIHLFEQKEAFRFGSYYRVTPGDIISGFSVNLAKILSPGEPNYYEVGIRCRSKKRRYVRGAIWFVSEGKDVNEPPNFFSVEEDFNTDLIPHAMSPEQIPVQEIHFTFDTDRIRPCPGDYVILGVYTDYADPSKDGSVAFQMDRSRSLMYSESITPEVETDEQYRYKTFPNRGLYIYNVDISSKPSEETNPQISVGDIVYRTLSSGCRSEFSASPSDKDLNSTFDIYHPIVETIEGSAYNGKWNTNAEGHPYHGNYNGFDFTEGNLKDVQLNHYDPRDELNPGKPITSSSDTAEKNLWVHSRSRILITIPYQLNGSSVVDTNSVIKYVVSETGSRGEFREAPSSVTEGLGNTLLLCPRDEGIRNNEPMTLILQRVVTLSTGITKSSPLLSIYFHTFADPDIDIAYPKDIINVNGDKANYVLWANEVLNNMYTESRTDSTQLCTVLNTLLTQSGGDDSGLPLFTRLSVQEFKGEYGHDGKYDGTFDSPSNDAIRKGEVNPTAVWTGLFRDDGKVIQLTGMNDYQYTGADVSYSQGYGMTWDGTIINDEKYASDHFDPEENYVCKVIRTTSYITGETTEEIEGVFPANHALCIGCETSHTDTEYIETLFYKEDVRMCFRSGYKYLINVRRFHSFCAGALSDAKYDACVSGGNYVYDANSEFPGSVPAAGPTKKNVYNSASAYPEDDSDSWIDLNNERHKNSSVSSPDTSTCCKRWIGPDSGYSGTSQSAIAFPGFTRATNVVIDCCSSIASASNITVTRPACQEVGADHWITFGYRHLNKSPDGMDSNGFGNRELDESTGEHYYKEITNDALTSDGRCNAANSEYFHYSKDKDDEGNIRTLFTNAWSGNPTTALRFGRMYFFILTEMLMHLAKELKKVNCYDSHCKENLITSATARVWISHDPVGKNSDKTNTPIYENLEFENSINYIEDESKFRDMIVDGGSDSHSTYLKDFMINVVKKPDDPVTSYTFNGETVTCRSINGEYEILYDDKDTSAFRCGNEYRWFSLVNPAKVSSSSIDNLIVNFKEPNISDANHMNSIYKTNDIDVNHGIRSKDTFDNTFSIPLSYESDESANISTKSYFNEWNNSGKIESNAVSLKLNSLFTSTPVKTSYPSSLEDSELVKNIEEDLNKNDSRGVQYFSGKNMKYPARLYLRVPPEQDCENGKTSKWIPIPSRRDARYPLVRTCHFLYYKTYTFGTIIAELCYKYTPHTPVYETVEDPETGETREVYQYCQEDSEKSVTNSYVNEDIAALQNIGNTTICGKDNYSHVLTVFGEDNGGLGRCLSADDYSNLKFTDDGIFQNIDYGCLEVPVRVRYTPLSQPSIIENDDLCHTLDSTSRVNHRCNNVISVIGGYSNCTTRTIIENGTPCIENHLRNVESFQVLLSYGMYRSAVGGSYYASTPVVDDTTSKFKLLSVYRDLQGPYNTDTFPSLGICNAFTVILIPSNAKNKIDYTKQPPNWFSRRSNYEDIEDETISDAKSVILYDIAKTECYKLDSSSDMPLDHKLRSSLLCEFNYKNMLEEVSVKTSVSSNSYNSDYIALTKRKNSIQTNVWYDLVVVPVFTSREGFSSDTYEDLSFQFKDGAGKIKGYSPAAEANVEHSYAEGAKDQSVSSNYVDYYGSNPLVISKFIKIAGYDKTNYNIVVTKNPDGTNSVKTSSCGGGHKPVPPTPSPDPSPDDPFLPAPFATEGIICFPNVNNVRYNCKNGWIRECPGFWLNNTFRVIIRGPHYRTSDQIKNANKTYPRTSEVSVESMTGQKTFDPHDYEISDAMIHIGGFWNTVKIWKPENPKTGEAGHFEDDTSWKEWRATENATTTTFNSLDFQKELNNHSLDKEWLNSRGIYTIRNNPTAFSKRVPDITDPEGNVRDTIKGGGFDHNDPLYKDRFFTFNPNMVDAHSPDPEGYYIQVRFLNSNYATSSQNGMWTEWCGGILNDTGRADIKSTSYDTLEDSVVYDKNGSYHYDADYRTCRKDSQLQYMVPIRNYTTLYTGFRSYMKESTLGSNLRHTSPLPDTPSDDINRYIIPGSGSLSELDVSPYPSQTAPESSAKSAYVGSGNSVDSSVVPSVELHNSTFVDESGKKYHPYDDNTDYPYPEMLARVSESGFSRPDVVYERYQSYWEMSYLLYVIRNMVKLYYSEWEEAIFGKADSKQITPKDLGWNASLASVCPDINWDDFLEDEAKNNLAEYLKTHEKSQRTPPNTDDLYRRIIRAGDFDKIVETCCKLLEFLRQDEYTGTKTNMTDSKNSSGAPTGLSVCVQSGDSLLYQKLNNREANRMKIGHLAEIDQTIESNYLQKISDIIFGEIIKDSRIQDSKNS